MDRHIKTKAWIKKTFKNQRNKSWFKSCWLKHLDDLNSFVIYYCKTHDALALLSWITVTYTCISTARGQFVSHDTWFKVHLRPSFIWEANLGATHMHTVTARVWSPLPDRSPQHRTVQIPRALQIKQRQTAQSGVCLTQTSPPPISG